MFFKNICYENANVNALINEKFIRIRYLKKNFFQKEHN